jgi:hypothetical protein
MAGIISTRRTGSRCTIRPISPRTSRAARVRLVLRLGRGPRGPDPDADHRRCPWQAVGVPLQGSALLVVEPAFRPARWRRVRNADRLGAGVEAHLVHRARLSGHRPRAEPAERLLRPEELGELRAVLLARLARRRGAAELHRGASAHWDSTANNPGSSTIRAGWSAAGDRALDLGCAALSVLSRRSRGSGRTARTGGAGTGSPAGWARCSWAAGAAALPRAGLPPERIDVSQLWGAAEGYVIGALESPRASIAALGRHFGFDAFESEGRIVFRMRSRRTAATVGIDDLVAAGARAAIRSRSRAGRRPSCRRR